MDLRLLCVVLYHEKSKMIVLVEDRDKIRRQINITWHRREISDVPPKNWLDKVRKEVGFQRAEAKSKVIRYR